MRERAMDDRDLDRFLNDLVADCRPDADGVDPSLADAARELRTLAHVVGSHGAHVQIDREVTAAIRELEMEEVSRPAIHLVVVPERRTTRPPMPVAVPVRAVPGVTRRARGISIANQVALAAILLLALVGSYLGLIAGRIGGGADETGTPSGVATDLLLDLVLPAGSLSAPAGADPGWYFARFSLRPGRSLRYETACRPDLIVGFVTDGSYVVRAQGTLQVLRNGAQPETFAAGEEVALATGDGYVYRNPGDDFSGFRNTASASLFVDEWQWYANYCSANSPIQADVRWLTYGQGLPQLDTGRPIRLRLRQMLLGPDAEVREGDLPGSGLLPAGTPGLEIVAAEPHFLEVTYVRPIAGGTPVTGAPIRQAWLSTLQVPAGTSRVVRNPVDRTLMLTIATLTEAGPGPVTT